MNEKLMLDEAKIKKIKKRVHKSLKELGIEIKLSEVSNIIANSIGFKNEYELQNCFNTQNLKSDNVSSKKSIAFNKIDPKEYEYFCRKDPENDIGVIYSENYTLLTQDYKNADEVLNFPPNVVKIILNDVKIDEKCLNDIISHIYPKLSRNGSILICGEEGTGKSLISNFLDARFKNEQNKEKNNFSDIVVQPQEKAPIKIDKKRKRATFCSIIVREDYMEQLEYFRNISNTIAQLDEFNSVENIIVIKWNK